MSRLHLRYAPRLTHDELVQRAIRWLIGSKGCVATWHLPTILTSEQPDAIGWRASGLSVVIEAKTSRADFRRDAEKWHRKAKGMGNLRYFLARQGVLDGEVVPEGWGFLECKKNSIREVTAPLTRNHGDKDFMGEIALLVRLGRSVPVEKPPLKKPDRQPGDEDPSTGEPPSMSDWTGPNTDAMKH